MARSSDQIHLRESVQQIMFLNSSTSLHARVGMTGVEPALPKELEPKSSASANFATSPLTNSSAPKYSRLFLGRLAVSIHCQTRKITA